ncbi:ead/Ea22-like family protein [Escherichia coli]|uniref:ead/Ea22-like family protein n=1 Tax=Escherichia coli TaxID=562 RepID=UPI000BE2315B|nr:ead/Ea22-like family protein [Escherichia coli]
MSKIDYQALREAAQNAKDLGGIKNYKRGEQAVAEFESLITPHIVLALLDEREDQSKRIAELETNLAVLAAENAGINSAIPEPRDIEDDNDNMDDVSLAEDFGFNHAIERMRKRIPETPATDAFLSEVRAQGVEMFADHLLCPDLDDTIRDFAAQLRKGVRS